MRTAIQRALVRPANQIGWIYVIRYYCKREGNLGAQKQRRMSWVAHLGTADKSRYLLYYKDFFTSKRVSKNACS